MPENLYDSETSISSSFMSGTIEAPPPKKSPSLAFIVFVELPEPIRFTVVSVSPPKSKPALSIRLTSRACDAAGAAAASVNASAGNNLRNVLPVMFFSPVSWAAGSEQSISTVRISIPFRRDCAKVPRDAESNAVRALMHINLLISMRLRCSIHPRLRGSTAPNDERCSQPRGKKGGGREDNSRSDRRVSCDRSLLGRIRSELRHQESVLRRRSEPEQDLGGFR